MKSQAEILEAHRRTIEVYTGKTCTIILTDKNEERLKQKTLTDILLTVETFNTGSNSILSNTVERDVVKLRKLFCFIANKAGYSARKTGAFLNGRDHKAITYSINTAEILLKQDEDFTNLYKTVVAHLIKD